MKTPERIGELCQLETTHDFDLIVIQTGRLLIAEASDADIRYPLVDVDEAQANLYPPHAERIGRTCTIAGRFREDATDPFIVMRQPMRPWGTRTVTSRSFIAGCISVDADMVDYVQFTVGLIYTRRAGERKLKTAPEKMVSAVKTLSTLEMQQQIDRATILC